MKFQFLMVALMVFNATAVAQNRAVLENIVFSKLAGNDVQINLETDGTVGQPSSFNTDNPARIALDFFGMRSELPAGAIRVNAGKVTSIVAAETAERTRIIINLESTSRYEVVESENGYAITVFNTRFEESPATEPKPFPNRPDIVSDTNVTNIDFRRTSAGGGNLTLDLSDPGVTVDTREQSGEIIVDLLGVNLPKELERRLDVVDFATPVQTIDAFQNADNVRLVVVPHGRYQHLAFQQGARFSLVVDPIVKTEEELEREKDAELGYEGERLSINFQKIDVRSALAVIADFTGINFVTSDSVQGEITINLKDVPWDQALDVIMKTQGLAKRQNGNVIWIAPAQEIAQIEEDELRAQVVAQEFAPLTSEIIQVNYARAADIVEVINSIRVIRQGNVPSGTNVSGLNVSATEVDRNSLLTDRGSVTVDERTNSVLVQDVAEKISELREVIAQLDTPIRQVLIETKIVQATDTFSRELGARLGFQRITDQTQVPGASGSNVGEIVTSGTTEGLAVIQDSQLDGEPGLIFDTSRGTPGGLAVDLGANGIDGNLPASFAFDIFRSGIGFAHLITLELSALEADGRGKIVASPRLITANQQEAVIRQGEERIFTSTTADTTAIDTEEAVLELQVTPQITPDDRVIMDIDISQDSFIAGPDGGSVAAIATQQIVTQVLADNGETIVIGGIYQETSARGETRVPLLGSLPFIGNLFRSRSTLDTRTELLIFLTPKIISPKLNLG